MQNTNDEYSQVKSWSERLKGRYYTGNLGVEARIILKWILVRKLTELKWMVTVESALNLFESIPYRKFIYWLSDN
jgi:hypothetical protein